MTDNAHFATAINCMDGRVQEPVVNYLKKRLGVTFVDMITEAGPDGILAQMVSYETINSIKRRIDISVQKHGSKHIAVIAHHDCAGNPVDADTHRSHVRSAVQNVRAWYPTADVFALWINEDWEVEEL
jgi:carbonic anhydrase